MKTDFDLIAETFGNIHKAMKNVSLLKGLELAEDHFADELASIFVVMFGFCGFCTKLFNATRKLECFVDEAQN